MKTAIKIFVSFIALISIITSCNTNKIIGDDYYNPIKAKQFRNSLGEEKGREFDSLYLEANCFMQKGNYKEAEKLIQHCLNINPYAAEAFVLQALNCANLEQDTLITKSLEKAVKLDPKDLNYLELLGQSYLGDYDMDKGKEVYEKLIAYYPSRTDILNILLKLYNMSQDYDKMLRTIERIEQVDGANMQTTFQKMYVYNQQNKSDEEYKVLREYVEKSPQDYENKVLMGNWLLQNNRKKEAFEEYNKILEESPDNLDASLGVMNYYYADKQIIKADSIGLKLLNNTNATTEDKIGIIQNIAANKKWSQDSTYILNLFNKQLQVKQKTSAMELARLSYIIENASSDENPYKEIKLFLQHWPEEEPVRNLFIGVALSLKKYDDVVQACGEAIKYNPEVFEYYYYMGLALYQEKKEDKAFITLQDGLKQVNAGTDRKIVSDVYSTCGDMLHQKNNDKEAFAMYEKALEYNPENLLCLNNYAYFIAMGDTTQLEKASQMSLKTINAEPTNSSFLDTYAYILILKKSYADAKEYIDMAIEYVEDDYKTVVEHAKEIYKLNGIEFDENATIKKIEEQKAKKNKE